MKKYFLLIVLVFLSACASAPIENHPNAANISASQDVMKNYFSKIKKFDGIDEEEAIILAQSELFFQGLDKNYYYNRPQLENEDEESYEILFDPINKTLAETQTNLPLVAIISKKDGSVILKK